MGARRGAVAGAVDIVGVAKEHLVRLETICGKNCEEYKDLAKAIADYK